MSCLTKKNILWVNVSVSVSQMWSITSVFSILSTIPMEKVESNVLVLTEEEF